MTETRATYDVGGSDLERAFLTHWRMLAPDAPMPVREYRFAAMQAGGPGKGLRKRLEQHGLRDWRADFAWPDVTPPVLVEIDGGNRIAKWSSTLGRCVVVGRHTTSEDLRKGNEAVLLGYVVLHFDGEMLNTDPSGCVAQVLRALGEVGSCSMH